MALNYLNKDSLFPRTDLHANSVISFPCDQHLTKTQLDEIVEATLTAFAYSDPNPQTSRFLINFQESEIDDILQNKIGISSSTQLLDNNLKIAKFKQDEEKLNIERAKEKRAEAGGGGLTALDTCSRIAGRIDTG